MQMIHQQPLAQQSASAPKAYYMDRLGNMSTSSSVMTSSSCSSTSSVSGGLQGRKQVLPLKQKPNGTYVHHLDHKIKEMSGGTAPVTFLALKKKEKAEKNIVTQLTYRKPGAASLLSSSASEKMDQHPMMTSSLRPNNQMMMLPRGCASMMSSSGYDTDGEASHQMMDFKENYANLLKSYMDTQEELHRMEQHQKMHGVVGGGHVLLPQMIPYEMIHPHDMLHSHPIWSPPKPSSVSSAGTASSDSESSTSSSDGRHGHMKQQQKRFLIPQI